jgi:transposase
MTPAPRFGLSDGEKDALLLEQAEMIQRLADRIAELEAIVGKPRKTSSNSHTPPSKDGPGRTRRPKRPAKKRPPRAGRFRSLAETPDKTERRMASACGHCGADVSGAAQRCRHRYDHIELPPIRPVVTRVEIFGGRHTGR